MIWWYHTLNVLYKDYPLTVDRTAVEERELSEAGQRVGQAIMNLRRSRHNRALQRRLYLFGDRELTPVQVDILETVVASPALRMNELAQALGVDASTASRTLAPLVDFGLVERRHDPRDRRTTIVAPTPAGLEQAARIREGRLALMRSVHGRFTPGRLSLFADLLEEYIAAVNAEGGAGAEQD